MVTVHFLPELQYPGRYCHTTDGPPKMGPPGPSVANYVAMDGPPGPSMAAIDGPPRPSVAS